MDESGLRGQNVAGAFSQESGNRRFLAWAIPLSIFIFLVDHIRPIGVAAGVPYIAIVLLSLWNVDRKYRLWSSVAVSVLTVVGFLVPLPSGSAFWIGIENRVLALFAIWVTTWLGDLAIRRTEQLREREARMRTVLDAAADAIITVDEHGIIESCNPAGLRMFGYDADEIIGRNVSVLMPSPYAEEHDGRLANYLEFGQPSVIGKEREVVAQRSDGEVFPIDLSISEVWLGNNRLFTAIVRDITERKRAQKRLLQAGRLAAIGQAMTGLAHESRNALQRSQACLELLGDSIHDNPEALDLIDDIQEAQDDLHRLYEDVRKYAAPLNLELANCHLAEIAGRCWEDLESKWSDRDASLILEGDAVDDVVEADPFALRQLFRNVLENALAACQTDPVVITLCINRRETGSQSGVEVLIRDNGPGITADVSRRIFEPFFTTKIHGTGLGLAICRRVADAHGGDIRLVSRDGGGAEFVLSLPRKV